MDKEGYTQSLCNLARGGRASGEEAQSIVAEILKRNPDVQLGCQK